MEYNQSEGLEPLEPLSFDFHLGRGGKLYHMAGQEPGTFDVCNDPPDQRNKLKRVLIVEDDPMNALFLREVVGEIKKGYSDISLVHVSKGEEAIRWCQNQSFDLVLMDIRLPSMDGLEAIRSIKSDHPDLPIVVETAYAYPEDRERAFLAGCDEYLAKPISLERLNQVLYRYLYL